MIAAAGCPQRGRIALQKLSRTSCGAASFGVCSARDLPYRFLQAAGVPRNRVQHLLGPGPFQCARRGRRMGWTGAKQCSQLRSTDRAGHLPASSLINQLSTLSLRARFTARPTVVDTILPACLFVSHSPVCSNLLVSVSCQSGRQPQPPLPPSSVHCTRARTRATTITQTTAPYLEPPRPHCAIGCPTILATKQPPQSQNTLQRGAWLLAHRIPQWLKAAAPTLVRPDRHLCASYG